MSTRTGSTRRRFFFKAGAAVAAPLAMAGLTREAAAAQGPAQALTRLAGLDALAAIRRVQQRFARHLNSGELDRARELFVGAGHLQSFAAVRSIRPADFGELDVIEIAADGRTASASFAVSAETEVPIAARGTLVEMARAQGEGSLRRARRGRLSVEYVRRGAEWKIRSAGIDLS